LDAQQGNRATVKRAFNTSDATSAKTLGVVAENIAPNADGLVTTLGYLEKVNTSAFTAGQTLYLGATAGTFTATKPVAPNHMVYVGVVVRANAGNGIIYVRCQNGYELDEIHDVLITSPATGNILMRNSSNLWVNTPQTSITSVGTLTGLAVSGTATVTASSGTAMRITNSGTGESFRVEDATGDITPFVIDASGNVGMGTATPLARLHITDGSANIRLNTSTTFADALNIVPPTSFNSRNITLNTATLTASRTVTLPDATGTVITTGNLSSITSTGTLSTPLAFSVGSGAVIKAIENRLVSGSGQSAAMYFGDGASGNTATGGIEVSWNTGNNDPIIGIGVTRDTNNTKITMSYAGIIRMFSQGAEKMSITTSAVSFANGVTAPFLTATSTLTSNSTLNTFGSVQVYNQGVSYPGASVGGGSSNQIGFRWTSPVVNCTVDNVISAACANFSDRRLKTNIQTLTNGIELVRGLRCVSYNPLDVIGFDEETFEPIIGDLDPYDEMLGFVADEVQEVYANAIQGEGNRIKSIDNVQLLSMAISAIQDLDQRLQQLETV
jgi:hypothetical protein